MKKRVRLCVGNARAPTVHVTKVSNIVLSSSKAGFGLWKEAAVALHTTFRSQLFCIISRKWQRDDFSTYGAIQKRREHKKTLKPAGFAPNSAEDHNLDTDKTVLRVRFFGSNAGEITSESGKQDSVSPADNR